MRTIRKYHCNLKELKGWPLLSKKSTIEIVDDKFGYTFLIEFGKRPKISIYDDSDTLDTTRCILERRVSKLKK